MSEDRLLEMYRQYRASQDKFAYFVLAGDASAIAYALSQGQDKSLSIFLIPWGLSLLLWGVSIYCGCRYIMFSISILYSDITLLQIGRGEHSEVNTFPSMAKAASDGIRDALKSKTKKASLLASLMIWLFGGGVLSYIVWQLIEMYLRTR